MAKRKVDCSLDEIVADYLKKQKCEKSLKLFGGKVGHKKNGEMVLLGKFVDYLKKSEVEKENANDEDLGFEINFGAFQPDQKYPSAISRKTGRSAKNSERKESGERKKKQEIPKEFIKKIRKLGMKEEDATILYETKIDWTAVYSKNKIFCTETRCDFYTEIDNEEMTKHVISKHKYGEYPCSHSHCNFVGFSQVKIRSIIIGCYREP